MPEAEPENGGAARAACECGSHRFARVSSKACNLNWLAIPHLEFETHGYMPSDLGIPGSGDGPAFDVCLDCGRVQSDAYPLSDDVLRQRIDDYLEECL